MTVFKNGNILRQVAEVAGISRSSIENAVIRFQLTSSLAMTEGQDQVF